MSNKSRIAFALGCVSALALSIPAFGVPAPESAKHQLQTQQALEKHTTARQAGAKMPATRLISTPVVEPLKRPLFGWPALVSEARKYMGTNPTARKRLWCATFMNMVLAKAGYAGTNSDAAKSFTDYGHRIPGPEIGAIAVLTRGKRGGHVGVVTGIDSRGNPIIISGNHGHSVGEGIYSRSRVIAYVMPTERRPGSVIQLASRAAPNMTVAPDAARHAQPAPMIDSPIAELLAAIEAEQTRSDARSRLAPAPASVPAPPRTIPRVTEQPIPHRVVQQLPDQAQPVVQAPPQRMRLGRIADADPRLRPRNPGPR